MDAIPAQENRRCADLINKNTGSAITGGTVNFYLVALTGANANKWFRNSDQTWQGAGTVCTTMVHMDKGHWICDVHADAWIDGVEYLEYAAESGSLDAPVSYQLRCRPLPNTTEPDVAGTAAGLHAVTNGLIAAVPAAARAEMDANSSKLDVAVSTRAASLSGAWAATVTLEDDSGDPVVGAVINVWNSAETVLYGRVETDSLGQAVVLADDGTYQLRVVDPSHTAFGVETLVVAGADQNVTYTGTAFDPGTSAPGTVRIFDWEYDATGKTPLAGLAVRAWPSSPGAYQAAGGIGFEPHAAATVTSADGYWYLDVAPSTAYTWDLTASRSRTYKDRTTPAAGSSQLRLIL